MTNEQRNPEQLTDVVAEYLHWRKVNQHIKGGENYSKRMQAALSTQAEARYLPVIEKLVEALEFIQMLGVEPNDLTDTVRIGRAENAARKALDLAAPLLKGGMR